MHVLALSALSWTACRMSSLTDGPGPLSDPAWTPSLGSVCMPAQVPGTVLAALLNNGTFMRPDNASEPIADPYVDDWLANASIPDISWIGKDFYTFVFRATLETAPACQGSNGARASTILSSNQLSYRASLYADGGADAVTLVDGGGSEAVGMFTRHDWSLGDTSAWCKSALHGFALLVSPPDHPGLPSALCPATPPAFNVSIPCGQGGDHSLAQDVISQDLGGWDWIAASPDRNTGIIDALQLQIAPAGVLLRDGATEVKDLVAEGGAYGARAASGASILFRASLLNIRSTPIIGDLVFTLNTSDSYLSAAVQLLTVSVHVELPARSGWTEAVSAPLPLPAGVALWWPHTIGLPFLRPANASFVADEPFPGETPTSIAWLAGLRSVSCDVNKSLGGRACAINGLPLFIEGGNFIGTDLLSRPAWRAPERYTAEVYLHAAMGFNSMRLWGGHAGHPEALFEAADRAGLLLWNEFFMSGDNNGRWAGNASWPLNHSLYGAAVKDTMKRLRAHASLLVYVGGNELFPFNASPPADVYSAMKAAASLIDPATPLVQSSMGSDEFSGFSGFDPVRAFAPSDGPYGILDERSFSAWPAPGKPANFTIPWAFQPEIGASAHPSTISAERFLTKKALSVLPRARGVAPPPTWAWHAFEGWGNDVGGDAVYCLAPNGNATPPSGAPGWNASDYAAAAGFAQESQVRALFEAYADRMWAPRSGVLYWKSASPWPALRGALYDFYLAAGGGFFGARHALESIHVQLSRRPTNGTVSIAVVNRGAPSYAGALFISSADAYVLNSGVRIGHQSFGPFNGPNTQTFAGVPFSHIQWPTTAPAGVALLWRIELAEASTMRLISRSEYVLSTLGNNASAAPQNLTELATLRARPQKLSVACALSDASTTIASVNVSLASPGVAVAVRCELVDRARAVVAQTGALDDRVLPLFASDGFFSLISSEEKALTLSAPTSTITQTLHAVCEAWNAPPVRAACGHGA
jgi:mannosylglycoprotein endo-beta-mannosidase